MGTEWGPGSEPMGKGEYQVAVNSRSSDASRSEGGSSASKLGAAVSSGAVPVATDNSAAKKKRTSKFLTKQFEILTKSSSGTSPRRSRGVNLLGQDYIIPVPGSKAVTATSNATSNADPDPKPDDRSNSNEPAEPSTGPVTPVLDHKPPIEFVTAPIDYKSEAQRREATRGEPPLDFIITERSPRTSPRVAALSTRAYASMSRSQSSLGRSPSGSERLSYSRSQRSVLSIPETVISSDEHGYSSRGGGGGSVQTASRSTSPSSLAEWSSHSLDRRGELSIAGLSLRDGCNISRRTDLSIGQSPDAQTLDYGPDDTDSGVEMYHETTSASPGSYSSRRSSCNLSEDWVPEFEDSDGASHHQFRRSRRRGSVSAHSRPQYRSASSSRRHHYPESSHVQTRDFYDQSTRRTNSSSRRRHQETSSPQLDGLLRKYGERRRGPVALDAMTPEEAIAVFHDEVARMLLEEGHECGEAADVEEFLSGYMRLRSPFYVAMVDEFFRAVCVDCYKRPVEVPQAASSLSSKSLPRTDRHLDRFNTRM